ncbi:MAG TPA: hypothetical protein DCF33_05915 [Saprospirales bacterium]|nr:hypothetical protein [Saprospirales bacterium]
MKAFFIFLALLFVIQANAQRPEPVSGAERNQSLVDPFQLQGPPPDTEPPVAVCLGIQNINIHTSGAITVWAADFISSLSDNVTPVNALKIGIRKAGTGTGYPVDAIGNSITSVTFSCAEMGLQQVEIWAIDEADNAAYCTAEILIQDPVDYCLPKSYDSLIVCVKTSCNSKPVVGANYDLYGSAIFIPPFGLIPPPQFTDTTGCGLLYLPSDSGITNIIGIANMESTPLNGVSTRDMLLLAKHILNIQPITDPYILLAADANLSMSVTTSDIVEFQNLIKGIYVELPNYPSWLVIDGSFQFPNPLNPFVSWYPSFITLKANEVWPDSVLFYCVKTGDMDCSATFGSTPAVNYPDAELVIKDTLLQAGQLYEMPIYMGSGGQWGGYQFGLSFDPAKLEFVDVTPTQWSDATDWAVFSGRLSTSWLHAPFPVSWQANEPMDILRMKALQPLQLSTVIQLETNGLHAEAYQGQDALIHDLTLHFEPQFKAPEVPVADKNISIPDPTQLQPPPPDTEPPVVICASGLNIPVGPSGIVTFWASDVLVSASDNITPAGFLKMGIRKAGTGSGFPVDTDGCPVISVTYNCTALGPQLLELWAIDEAGNADYCTAEIQLQDPFFYCNPGNDSVILCVRSGCNNEPMPGISYSPLILPLPPVEVTDSNGCGVIYIPPGISAVIAIEKDDAPANGVNTLDMLRISQHITGVQPIMNPYLLIAADANKSGSITTFDIIEFQKLIKGIYTQLPSNTSWRFIDGSFQFPNPLNPFMTAFPEIINISDEEELPDSILVYGVKIGDIDCSATLDSLGPVDYPDANLVIKDTLLQAGQVYEMPIYMGSGGQWGGYQFALSFDPSQLECVGVTTTQWSGPGHWAAYPGRVSTSWIHAPFPVSWQANEPMAILRMKALQPLQLSTVLQLETNGLHAEAYEGQDALIHDLTLHFEPQFKAPEVPVADKIIPGPDPTQLVDQAPPVLVCFSGFSVNIMPTGMVNLWSSDFVESVWDNATTPGLIDLAVRKAGTGSGFPEDALGEPIYNVLFSCLDLGSQTVEVWARDLAGNTTVCQTVVEVQDNNSNCENQAWNVKICAKTETADGVEENQYIVTGNNPTGPFFANQVGDPNSDCGYFEAALGSNITASILKDDNPLNGVTTFDLVLIAKHIEGVDPLNSPYKIIAADIDKSGVIDSTDITELYKLIIGFYTELPNNTSWRFVPWDFVFQDPANPFITPFPESVTIQNLQFMTSINFVAIKVGDVNGSATPNSIHQVSEERQSELIAPFIGNAYPNPTPSGAVIPMDLHANTWVSCSVYTMQGRQVWMNESELPAGVHSLDIPAEAFAHPGMYIWRVRAGDTVKTGKIVVK